LKYIRENLKFFIRSLGYEPILSEEGNVFYDPNLHVQDACLAEVPSCQILLLIIGGHFGGRYKDTDESITNAEYLEAVKAKIPIFALVEQPVYEQFQVYTYNKMNKAIDPAKISYPSVDSQKIFDFIGSIQGQVVNNALFPFSDFEDIQSYLKQQWAGMMYRFLTTESESRRVSDLLSSISNATTKIEFLTRQVVNSVGDPIAKLNVDFYDYLLSQQVAHDLTFWGLKPSPKEILKHNTFDEFCKGQIQIANEEEEGGDSITGWGPPYRLSQFRYDSDNRRYSEVRNYLVQKLDEAKITIPDFIQSNESEEVNSGENNA
jgi:hypothetical protein